MSQIETIEISAPGRRGRDRDYNSEQPRGSGAQPTEFIEDGETLLGHGYGGSESLTFFIQCPTHGHVVRKVLSAPLITAAWDRNGNNVMLPPHVKARRQAEWLQKLPARGRAAVPTRPRAARPFIGAP
jgi:hypothetical protein